MKTRKYRWIQLLVPCWCIAAAIIMAACSHWPGSERRSDQRGSAHHFTKSDMVHFLDSIRYKQSDSGEHYRLGRYFQQRGRHMLALTEFSRAIDLDPQRADAQNAMGVSYDQLRQFDMAERCYRRALVLKPDFAAAYNNLGYSYLMRGKPEKAIVPLQKAVFLQDRNTRFHNNLALAYRQTGQKETALVEFKPSGRELQTQSLDPQSSPLGSVDPTEEFHRIENADEDEHPPVFPASLTSPGTAPSADQYRPSVAKASRPVEHENHSSRAMPGNIQPDPLWLTPQIEIANGNGAAKMARNIGNYFRYKGFDVHRVTNAEHFEYPRTRIFYSDGQRQVACTLSRTLFGPDMVCELIYNGRKYGRIKVLMGKDMAGLNDLFSGRLRIQVANGNGVKDMAGKLTAYLRTKGFYVVRPVNAGHFEYEHTQIFYPAGRLTNAQFVAREFPESDSGRLVEDDRQSDTIYIIIGKDFTL